MLSELSIQQWAIVLELLSYFFVTTALYGPERIRLLYQSLREKYTHPMALLQEWVNEIGERKDFVIILLALGLICQGIGWFCVAYTVEPLAHDFLHVNIYGFLFIAIVWVLQSILGKQKKTSIWMKAALLIAIWIVAVPMAAAFFIILIMAFPIGIVTFLLLVVAEFSKETGMEKGLIVGGSVLFVFSKALSLYLN